MVDEGAVDEGAIDVGGRRRPSVCTAHAGLRTATTRLCTGPRADGE
eukprot:CAMPEP_0174744644 /NCGR_PEP_ID=MMETSP1094-20130205/84906_1 /TAXON_ID=156173 /ORGANISM="Chrysochromulina brevifilum, Strain UTEX LB 985" /LENGTH=45 /DNA_ID= /DNA_START= /DNA_END= /DNA_ORIENTATION=